MCGIAGALYWNGLGPADETAPVSSMVSALGHRGPDGRGVLVCEGRRTAASSAPTVVLGHTRLAILDLSERGAQPMRSSTGRSTVTFNGEIYNFAELRRELERGGRRFSSGTDTEVLLEGYEHWGIGVVDRLRGMFAFALWDAEAQTLLLARDRLGIKPIYTYQDDSGLMFASEIRGLLASQRVPRRLDRRQVRNYLKHQTVPAPHTLVEGVRALPPGHLLHVETRNTSIVSRQYWDMLDDTSAEATGATPQVARARVRELLVESTALHLISDVPIGIFLSGGIDSSAIVALTRAAGTAPETFSVVLPGSVHDEAVYAREVADRFGASHTEIALTEADFRDQLPAALASVDHPSGDGLNTYVVSGAVRRAGIKVALSGLGGDELFGGYPSFRRIARAARYAGAWKHAPSAVRPVAAGLVRAIGRGGIGANRVAAVLETDGSAEQVFPTLRQLFTTSQIDALIASRDRQEAAGDDPYERLLAEAVRRHPSIAAMDLVSYGEARTYMHDVLLRDTDQMTMAHGLEARVPLLDHKLTEWVMGLPEDVKVPGPVQKRLLVESLGDLLPAGIANRPKQGFVLPFDRWMRGDLRSFCESHLGEQGLAGRGVVRRQPVDALWQSFLAGDGRTNWARPWALVALDSWLALNGIDA